MWLLTEKARKDELLQNPSGFRNSFGSATNEWPSSLSCLRRRPCGAISLQTSPGDIRFQHLPDNFLGHPIPANLITSVHRPEQMPSVTSDIWHYRELSGHYLWCDETASCVLETTSVDKYGSVGLRSRRQTFQNGITICVII